MDEEAKEKQRHDVAMDIQMLLNDLGLNPEENPHLEETPTRVANTFLELTTPQPFTFTVFDSSDIDQMISVTNIPFYSLCAHHLLPFFGSAHVGYIPNGKMAGLSKLSRTVEYFSKGINVQEELTHDIKEFLEEHLEPKGTMVVLEARHLCMEMRGAETRDHKTTTSAVSGVFLNPEKQARTEFLELLRR